VVAAALALVFELRAFCRYLCPIDAFVGLYGKAGKLALRPRIQKTCDDCTVLTCLKGSAKGWACPYGLVVRDVHENDDCGLCSECLKTCPYDNVGVFWRPAGEERSFRDLSGAWLAMVMLVLGVAYSLVYLGPWPWLRDQVNLLDRANWTGFAGYAAALWTTALVLFPGVMAGATAAGRALSGAGGTVRDLLRHTTGALIPLGLGVWAAFVTPMLMVNGSFVLQSLSDPFGWNWDLFGTRIGPWVQIWPAGIPWIQSAVLLLGYGYALRNGYRAWRDAAGDRRSALRGFAPTALVLFLVTGLLVLFFTN